MVASQLRMEMSSADYNTWVKVLKPLSFKEGVYRLGAVNVYARDWVESRLSTRISRLLESILNQSLSLRVVLLKGDERPEPEIIPVTRAEALPRVDIDSEPPADEIVDLPRPAAPEKAASRPEGRKRKPAQPDLELDRTEPNGSPRKIQLQRAYGTERARVIQPERGMFMTAYFLNNWLPLLSHSAAWTILAARSLCYWNPMTGELRNVIETDMSELAKRAAVSVRTVKDVLNNELVKSCFLRYKVRRVMTPNGVRTAGILLQVRMDDPMTPEDQDLHSLPEDEHWYTVDFMDEED